MPGWMPGGGTRIEKVLVWNDYDEWERKARLSHHEMFAVMHGIREKIENKRLNDFFWHNKL